MPNGNMTVSYTHMLQKNFNADTRWYFGQFEKGIFHKKLQWKCFHCIDKSHDVHKLSHDIVRYTQKEEETEIFASIRRDY